MRAIVMATLLGVALLVSCQHGTRPAATPPTSTRTASKLQKAACRDVCHRTFRDCLSHLLLATGKVTQVQLDGHVRTGLMSMARMTGYVACMQRCERVQTGLHLERTRSERRCLRCRTCKAYAACMVTRRIAKR